ncbi:MAG: Abi family protein [Bacteroidales bacterium]|nr:Abi family protein [Bacteroidales bacterium]
MRYNKPPLTRKEQIQKLKERGLKFEDEVKAEAYLKNISFYRLRAYTYPFQDNHDPEHPFIQDVSFDQIIHLYIFDRRLRILVLNAIEKIEVAFRTHIIYNYSLQYGGHWFTDSVLFHNETHFHNNMEKITEELHRSNETFIKHYFDKYTSPKLPPAWMTLEAISMGTMGKLFSNLKRDKLKKKTARGFGLKETNHLENWMHVFGNLRNICAHHGRLWNRRFPTLVFLPRDTLNSFIDNIHVDQNKLYAQLCCINYIIQQIAPKSNFVSDLKALINKCPMVNCRDMGFPENWEEEALWK